MGSRPELAAVRAEAARRCPHYGVTAGVSCGRAPSAPMKGHVANRARLEACVTPEMDAPHEAHLFPRDIFARKFGCLPTDEAHGLGWAWDEEAASALQFDQGVFD
eukprot:CAMPEP_0181203668 /NCGR_PEP_ID=MMETSP1096-20121128/19518_1 /TAXON_ID=156174 ORGANISM="Chrysochromulina ericina, Strain CCMP281" /NCGR_SAMPLE_ID=MMETSP1096 /ASSEMBLY_ACC=CAM_ASM_000453 /LENGTH=104 /DNA_ID=CAMNT_0023294303 /DNA_START=425 /DNA_END=740 /DNA_ORIENTATION=+